MFTGLIKEIGTITDIQYNGTNITFFVESEMSSHLTIDESVSHDGVCLTIEKITTTTHQVTAIAETLEKTTLSLKNIGDKINLERAMLMNERLGGHIVQGHVDTTAECIKKEDKNGSIHFRFQMNPRFASLIIEKGSITINGISLTIFGITHDEFSVGIIPYTYHHTTLQYLKIGDVVNVEFDILGKYFLRWEQLKDSNP